MSYDIPLSPVVAAPTAMPEAPISRRRRAENFTNELGALLQQADGLAGKLAELRAQREITERMNPEQARAMAQEAIKFGKILEVIERTTADKARRDTLDRARELYIDLRIRLEFADKHFAEWRSAVSKFQRDAEKGTIENRADRETELTEKQTEYEAWVDMAYAAVPGTGIQLLSS